MSAALSRDWKSDLREVVRECVRMHLPEGTKRAQDYAARMLGLSPRRVRAWWQGEVRTVTVEEAGRIHAARARLYEQELALLDAKRDLVRARIAAIREEGAPDIAA